MRSCSGAVCRTGIACLVGSIFVVCTPCAAQSAISDDYKKPSDDLARRIVEIEQRIAEGRLPSKTYISPSTKSVAQAFYYKQVNMRLERLGTENFPSKNGNKLYGEMIVSIPIYQDGSLFLAEGGPRIEKSSGDTNLDSAALEIIRSAAPFARFPASAITPYKNDVWIVITSFKFGRENLSTGTKTSP